MEQLQEEEVSFAIVGKPGTIITNTIIDELPVEVTNRSLGNILRSLGNILRSLVSEHPNQWDLALPQAEFSYNDSPNRSTGLSPFKIVYGTNPRGVFELRDLGMMEKRSADAKDFAPDMQLLHEQVKEQL